MQRIQSECLTYTGIDQHEALSNNIEIQCITHLDVDCRKLNSLVAN